MSLARLRSGLVCQPTERWAGMVVADGPDSQAIGDRLTAISRERQELLEERNRLIARLWDMGVSQAQIALYARLTEPGVAKVRARAGAKS